MSSSREQEIPSAPALSAEQNVMLDQLCAAYQNACVLEGLPRFKPRRVLQHLIAGGWQPIAALSQPLTAPSLTREQVEGLVAADHMTNWKADPKVQALLAKLDAGAVVPQFKHLIPALCEAVAASGSPPSPFDDPARVLEAVRQMGASSPWHKDGDTLCVPGPVAREVFNAAYNYHEPIGEILNRAAREVQPLIDKEREGMHADGETLNMRFGASSGSTGAPDDLNAKEVWAILYEDADRQVPEVFVGEGAEAAARRTFADRQMNWTCQLLTTAGSTGGAPT